MKNTWVIAILLASSIFIGCSGPESRGPKETPDETTEAPHTGDSGVEEQTPDSEAVPPKIPNSTITTEKPPVVTGEPTITGKTPSDKEYYVFPDRLRLRATPFIIQGNILAILETNDKVVVRSENVYEADSFVYVEVISERANLKKGLIGYVPLSYLTEKPKELTVEQQDARTYFVIQNIATEKLRVYERCTATPNCAHKLIIERDMVAGENKDRYQTQLGFYKINNWHKFYEDGQKHYPAWYRPNYPAVPVPGSGLKRWMKDQYMPNGLPEAKVRGAFGWFTATVGPNSAAQWTHGTIGWGDDSLDAISFKETFGGKFLDLFAKIRSSGCSRVDNPTISFMQWLLPVGTPIIKIYAKESVLDGQAAKTLGEKDNKFAYIITKVNYGKTGRHAISADEVQSAKIAAAEYLEAGDLVYSSRPTVAKGNTYKVNNDEFVGTFLVDAGMVSGYQHPKSLKVGGFSDQKYPPFVELGPRTK